MSVRIPLLVALSLWAVALGAIGTSNGPRRITDFAAQDFRGQEISLDDFADKPIVVVAFLGVECPLASLYGERLATMAAEYEAKGVAFVGVDSNRQDSTSEMAAFARKHAIRFPFLKDVGNRIADQFGAERTPEVFVLDRKRAVRYRGRIDDQYGIGSSAYAQSKVRQHYLAESIEDLLADRDVRHPHTPAQGCLIGRVRTPRDDSPITYCNQVSRILQRHCVECHRDGQIAPFALTHYEEVAGWADMIEEVVNDGRMPPWHADPRHGKFSNERHLSDDEKQTIAAWVGAGAPEGNRAELPDPVAFRDGWQFGKPDQIIHMHDQPFDVPATGTVEYQYFLVDPGWTEDRWIKATECQMGNREVVHHIFVFAIAPGDALAKVHGHLGAGVQPRLGDGSMRLIAGAAPNTPPNIYRDGSAIFVGAGTKLLFQMHYTPRGSRQQDRSMVGFRFASADEVRREVDVQMAINASFVIPPNANDYPVRAVRRFTRDALLLNLTPHMHLRGKSFQFDLKYPDGRVETLLNVPRYDFNWQVTYTFERPQFVPAGSELVCQAHFDNSAANAANPDPSATVTWGDQTWEEMMIGWFNKTDDVYPEDVQAADRRAVRFAASAGDGPLKVGRSVERAAAHALHSDAALEKCRERLTKEVPQVDRVCLSVIEKDKLRFVLVAQPRSINLQLGRDHRTTTVNRSALAAQLRAGGEACFGDLRESKQGDLAAMSRIFGSCACFVIQYGERPAVLTYWSKEQEAFPPSAIEYLRMTTRMIDDAN